METLPPETLGIILNQSTGLEIDRLCSSSVSTRNKCIRYFSDQLNVSPKEFIDGIDPLLNGSCQLSISKRRLELLVQKGGIDIGADNFYPVERVMVRARDRNRQDVADYLDTTEYRITKQQRQLFAVLDKKVEPEQSGDVWYPVTSGSIQIAFNSALIRTVTKYQNYDELLLKIARTLAEDETKELPYTSRPLIIPLTKLGRVNEIGTAVDDLISFGLAYAYGASLDELQKIKPISGSDSRNRYTLSAKKSEIELENPSTKLTREALEWVSPYLCRCVVLGDLVHLRRLLLYPFETASRGKLALQAAATMDNLELIEEIMNVFNTSAFFEFAGHPDAVKRIFELGNKTVKNEMIVESLNQGTIFLSRWMLKQHNLTTNKYNHPQPHQLGTLEFVMKCLDNGTFVDFSMIEKGDSEKLLELGVIRRTGMANVYALVKPYKIIKQMEIDPRLYPVVLYLLDIIGVSPSMVDVTESVSTSGVLPKGLGIPPKGLGIPKSVTTKREVVSPIDLSRLSTNIKAKNMYTIPELKMFAKERGLLVGGNKVALSKRLLDYETSKTI